MKHVPRIASGGGEKGMWVRESTKNDGSLAQHFRAGCNLFTVPIIQIVHSEEYIQVCTKIYQRTKETTNRKIKMKTIFTNTYRIHNIQKIRVCLRYRCNTLADLVNKPFVWVWPPFLKARLHPFFGITHQQVSIQVCLHILYSPHFKHSFNLHYIIIIYRW